MDGSKQGLGIVRICLSILALGAVLAAACGDPESEGARGLLTPAVLGDCTNVTLTGNPTEGTILAGTSVTFTASANCLGGTPEYAIAQRRPNGTWTTPRGWSSTATFVWNTMTAACGNHQFLVKARAQGTAFPYEGASARVNYTLAGAAVTLTASPAGTQAIGQPVTLTMANDCEPYIPATSSVRAFPAYHLQARTPTGGWTPPIQRWSMDSTAQWDTTGLDPGTYTIWARSLQRRAGNNSIQAYDTLTYTLSDKCTSATLTASPPVSQAVGGNVTFSFEANCPSGVTPMFHLQARGPSGSWLPPVQKWSTATSVQWSTSGQSTGDYTYYLRVLSQGNTVMETYDTDTYSLTSSCSTVPTSGPGICSAQQSGSACSVSPRTCQSGVVACGTAVDVKDLLLERAMKFFESTSGMFGAGDICYEGRDASGVKTYTQPINIGLCAATLAKIAVGDITTANLDAVTALSRLSGNLLPRIQSLQSSAFSGDGLLPWLQSAATPLGWEPATSNGQTITWVNLGDNAQLSTLLAITDAIIRSNPGVSASANGQSALGAITSILNAQDAGYAKFWDTSQTQMADHFHCVDRAFSNGVLNSCMSTYPDSSMSNSAVDHRMEEYKWPLLFVILRYASQGLSTDFFELLNKTLQTSSATKPVLGHVEIKSYRTGTSTTLVEGAWDGAFFQKSWSWALAPDRTYRWAQAAYEEDAGVFLHDQLSRANTGGLASACYTSTSVYDDTVGIKSLLLNTATSSPNSRASSFLALGPVYSVDSDGARRGMCRALQGVPDLVDADGWLWGSVDSQGQRVKVTLTSELLLAALTLAGGLQNHMLSYLTSNSLVSALNNVYVSGSALSAVQTSPLSISGKPGTHQYYSFSGATGLNLSGMTVILTPPTTFADSAVTLEFKKPGGATPHAAHALGVPIHDNEEIEVLFPATSALEQVKELIILGGGATAWTLEVEAP